MEFCIIFPVTFSIDAVNLIEIFHLIGRCEDTQLNCIIYYYYYKKLTIGAAGVGTVTIGTACTETGAIEAVDIIPEETLDGPVD